MWRVDQWAGCCRVTTQSQKTFLSEAPHRRDLCSLQDGQTVVWRVHCRWRQGLLQRCTLSCLQHGVTNSISAHRCGLTGHQVYYLVNSAAPMWLQVSFPFPFLSFAHSNGLRLKGVLGPWLGLAALSNTSAQSVSRITITQLYVSRVTWRDKRTFSFFFFKTPFNCNLDTDVWAVVRAFSPLAGTRRSELVSHTTTNSFLRDFVIKETWHRVYLVWAPWWKTWRIQQYLVTWTNYLPRKRKGWSWARERGPGAEVVGCIVAHKTV